MIDLHVHLLPGVDDGPGSAEEALGLCRRAADDGCQTLVATPHQRHPQWSNRDAPTLKRLLRELQEQLATGPRLLLGAEIRVDSELLTDLEDLEASGLLPLAESRYLLLELDHGGLGPDPLELVFELKLADWRPILAHPELLPSLGGDLEAVAALVDAGALLQVTAGSLTGKFGRTAQETTHRLLDSGLVHFVASDAHGVRWRRPGLARARALIGERWGEQMADDLTLTNPSAVIENRQLPA